MNIGFKLGLFRSRRKKEPPPPPPPPPPPVVYDYNYARPADGASATASHSYNLELTGPQFAIDSNDGSKWQPGGPHPYGWLRIDLGQNRTIGGARVYASQLNSSNLTNYKLQTSVDDSVWVDLLQVVPTELVTILEFEVAKDSRYWRLVETSGNTIQVNTWELYGVEPA